VNKDVHIIMKKFIVHLLQRIEHRCMTKSVPMS